MDLNSKCGREDMISSYEKIIMAFLLCVAMELA